MLKMKKTTLAILALGSSVCFAGTMGPVCEPVNVVVPCATTAWDIGGQALYLKSSYSANSAYAGLLLVDGVQVRNEFDVDWGWGFKLEASYHFNTGNDLNVNWYHFNRTSTNNLVATVPVAPGVVTDLAFTSSLEPKWDAVNFELGQHAYFGEFKDIRFHGGFQYLRLAHDIQTFVPLTGQTFGITSDYKGFGPRIGSDFAYNLGNGLAMYANGAAALLVGDSKLNGSLLLTGGVPVSATKLTVVPEMEAKTGLKYNYAMAQGLLTVDAGYMWVNYFNAQQATTVLPDETNVAFNGAYVGLKWIGSI